MDLNFVNSYLERAREIVGERTPGEAAYDDAVVEHLARARDIKKAIKAANIQHPKEALKPKGTDWPDLEARYEYLKEHKAILRMLGIKG